MEPNKKLSADYRRVQSISILSELEILLFQCQNSFTKSPKDVSRSGNEGSSKGSSKEKKASRWVGVKKLLCALRPANRVSYESGSESGSKSGSSQNPSEEEKVFVHLRTVIGRIKTILKDKQKYEAYTRVANDLDKKADELRGVLKEMLKEMGPLSKYMTLIKSISKGFSSLKSDMLEKKRDLYLPGLHWNIKDFLDRLVAKVMEKIQDLEFNRVLCLLSFTVFPEDFEVKKTMLMYWWIGEGFISAKCAELTADSILDEFSSRGLIEPVKDDRKLKPNNYKMDPRVHSAVIYLAKAVGFFNIYKEKKPSMDVSGRHKVCLVAGSSLQEEAKVSKMRKKLDSVKTVFNSSERFPDFTFKWFPHMPVLKVLYVGRWERTPKRHIEVESTKFPENIKTMKELKLVSFQGISRIEKLNNYICQLSKLLILDLRSCYNLEVLPDDIDSLENLIYLDVSECYMLDRMPKEISKLSNLKVLKGFVVSDADEENCCTLSQLENMMSLRKLSININKYDLEVADLMKSLTKLTELESLKIAWGARFQKDEEEGTWFKKARRKKEKLLGFKLGLKSTNKKEGDQGDNKGKANKDKKGDVEKTGTLPLKSKDRVQNKKEDGLGSSKTQMKGDGKVKKVDLEEHKEHGGIEAETQKSDKVVKKDNKASPSHELERVISKKQDGHKGDDKEQKKQDGEEAKTQKSDKVVEEDKKASPSQEPKPVIPKKPDDHKGNNEEQKKEDGRKEVDEEEIKEHGREETKTQKSNKVIQENKNTIPSPDLKGVTQKKQDDHRADNNEQMKEGRRKEVDQDESTEHRGEEAETQKSDKVQEGESFAIMKKPLIQKKPDDPKGDSKEQKKEDGKTGEVDVGEGKEHDGLDARGHNIHEIIKEDKEKSASQDSKATVHKEPHDNKGENVVMTNPATNSSDSGEDKKKETCQKPRIIKKPTKNPESNGTYYFPSKLKTLELEGFPEEELTLNRLKTQDSGKLERLAIRGGKLSRIGEPTSDGYNNHDIKVLRLKYLDEFKAEWRDLQAMFPNMMILEKYKCPKVTFCPTDGNGVWRKPRPHTSTQKS